MRQQSFQGINADPMMDPSLKSIKGHLNEEATDEKDYKRARKYLKKNSAKITRRIIHSFH